MKTQKRHKAALFAHFLRIYMILGSGTFSPLALLMALRGRSTRRTRRILTTEMALELQTHADHEFNCPAVGGCYNDTARVRDIFNTDCRKKETRETLTTSRSSRLNQFLQKEPWWRKAPWTVI